VLGRFGIEVAARRGWTLWRRDTLELHVLRRQVGVGRQWVLGRQRVGAMRVGGALWSGWQRVLRCLRGRAAAGATGVDAARVEAVDVEAMSVEVVPWSGWQRLGRVRLRPGAAVG
jgi:hypothetical protein